MNTIPTTRSPRVLAGLFALAAAVLAAWAPWHVLGGPGPAALDSALADSVVQRLLVAALLLGVAGAAWRILTDDGAAAPPLRSPGAASEREDAGTATTAGTSELGADGRRSARHVDPIRRDDATSAVGHSEVVARRRRRLQSLAVTAVALAEDVDEATARERVAAGSWTDDAVAADALGDERAPDPPLAWRLYAWIWEGRAGERAVERTIDTVESALPEGQS